MSGYRKSALCLHGLHEDDRSWLLEKLPQSNRKQLSLLLLELKALGIPSEDTFQDLVVPPVKAESMAFDQSLCDEYELDCAEPKVIGSVLLDEPPWVVAFVLACRCWSWGSMLTKLYEKSYGCRLALPVAPNPRVKRALLSALLLRVRAADELRIVQPDAVEWRSHGIIKRLSQFLWLR